MCVRPRDESPTEELDEILWKLFKTWKAYASVRAEDEDRNEVDDFCRCVRARLEKLVRERAERVGE